MRVRAQSRAMSIVLNVGKAVKQLIWPGVIVASPSSGDGYYNAGASVQLTATPAAGYAFSAFSGGLTGGLVADHGERPGVIQYRHREALYPSAVFRAAFDRLVADHGERPGVIEYLHVLKLAAEETVEKVEPVLRAQLALAEKWRATQV